MKSIGVKIVSRSPLLLAGAPPASTLTETLLFIPGNTVRGMLAYRYIEQGGTPADNAFRRLFIAGEARFGFACVEGSQPIPLSARSCKYESGFINDHGHGVVDLLLSSQEEKLCGRCGYAIDYVHGFWNPNSYRSVPVRTRLITRTAIDSSRGSARMKQLYSQRVLEEGQTFRAAIEVPDDLEPLLAGLLSQPRTSPARIGTGTSRGQGWVEVSQANSVTPNWGLAADRFTRFQQKHGSSILVVTLLSEGLFHDNYLRDVTAPSPYDLAPLGVNPDEWNPGIVAAFMDTRLIFGFDGEPLLLPRQPRLAVAAGSVFLFQARDGYSDPVIPPGNGIGWIGDRNSEGYGQAVLWHPCHLRPEGGQP